MNSEGDVEVRREEASPAVCVPAGAVLDSRKLQFAVMFYV